MPCQVCSGSILLKTSVERIFKFSKPSWRVLAAETRGTASVRSDSANELPIGFEDDPNGKCGAFHLVARILRSLRFRVFQQKRSKADIAK